MNYLKIFKVACLYSLFWYALSLLLLSFDSGGALFTGKVQSSLVSLDALGHLPIIELLGFASVQMACLLFFALLITLISWPLCKITALRQSMFLVVTFVALLVGATFVAINDYFFPFSIHPLRISDSVDFVDGKWPVAHLLVSATSTFFIVYTIIYYFRRNWVFMSALSLVLFSLVIGSFFTEKSDPVRSVNTQKNVFLIGVDSLRLDALVGDDSVFRGAAPAVESFVNDALNFENALTPQARTYAAWTSVLSGYYPIETGARFNLIGDDNVTMPDGSLADTFVEEGYQTVFATDERRFSNIGHREGFEYVVGSIVGASDFLIGSLSNNPFLNWLWLTPYGKWVLPHSNLNRAVAHTYTPSRFSSAMAKQLDDLDKGRPIFMAAHFCLAHYPYYDHGSDTELLSQPVHVRYSDSLKKVDHMVGTLLGDLKARGMLENALVVLFSDHGEGLPSLALEQQGVTFDKLVIGRKDRKFGHGTDVLDDAQYKVVLAIQEYEGGALVTKPQSSALPASLIDIVPTVLNELGWSGRYNGQGRDLVGAVSQFSENDHGYSIFRFLEGGFVTKSMMPGGGDVDETAILAETAKYYRVNKDGRLQISDQYLPSLVKGKQRAVEKDLALLAYIEGEFVYREAKSISVEPFVMDTENKKLMAEAFCRHFSSDNLVGEPSVAAICETPNRKVGFANLSGK